MEVEGLPASIRVEEKTHSHAQHSHSLGVHTLITCTHTSAPTLKAHTFSLEKAAPSFPVQEKTHRECKSHATHVGHLSSHTKI